MKKKKISWRKNDVVAIPLMDNSYGIGHILDQRMPNSVRVALYSEVLGDLNDLDPRTLIYDDHLLSLIEVTREQLDYGVWKIIENKATLLPIDSYANEKFRADNWKNSIVRDAAIAEGFLNAYHALLPWDKYYDPAYFDKMLISHLKKPQALIYKQQ